MNVGGVLVNVIEFEARETEVEFPVREEKDVFPTGGKNRGKVNIHVVSQLKGLVLFERVDPDCVLSVFTILGVDHPFGIRRPVIIRDIEAAGLIDDRDFFRLYIQNLKVLILVGEQKLRTVG